MSSWSSVEERRFQELVRRAEQQSRDYYSRAVPHVESTPETRCAPPPCEPKPQTACTLPAEASAAQPLLCLPAAPSAGAAQKRGKPTAHAPAHTEKEKKPKSLMPEKDTILLVALIWLLLQEEADIKLILALGYILLV